MTTAEVKRFVDDSVKHCKNLEKKVGLAFVSVGSLGGGGEIAFLDILRVVLVYGVIVPGFVSGGRYCPLSMGSPGQDGKKVCIEFGSKVVDIVKKLTAKL